ncbi:hypothetical protein RFI_20279, partial [Reticulomyxa filosa]
MKQTPSFSELQNKNDNRNKKMTDIWKSNPRYYCKTCGCWLDAKASSIRRHEQGSRHQSNVTHMLQQIKRDKLLQKKAESSHNHEISQIETAAKKAYVKDCANGVVDADGQTSAGALLQSANNSGSGNNSNSNKFYETFHGSNSTDNAVRVRRHFDVEFSKIRDIEDPFDYKKKFLVKWESNYAFRDRMMSSVDIKDRSTLPPNMGIPQALLQSFQKEQSKTDDINDANNDDKDKQ